MLCQLKTIHTTYSVISIADFWLPNRINRKVHKIKVFSYTVNSARIAYLSTISETFYK